MQPPAWRDNKKSSGMGRESAPFFLAARRAGRLTARALMRIACSPRGFLAINACQTVIQITK
ncbi:hypothetical protein BN134_1800 [Cronobacter dublinensis 1210]|uniref:Uncharacterized protein n=1 Tax=Cronobacter dublinensis 1210 TaxID=1208656 RepID=A0ABP1W6G2_9ENTR|nr:hypothetical protein BN134_1800 [Cronobacter dublinensis 1210]